MCADTKKERSLTKTNVKDSVMSMTGFGHAVISDVHDRYVAEVRSVNSRYSEVRIYGIREDFSLEFELGKLIKQKFERGKFDLTLRKEANEKSVHQSEEKKVKNHFQYLKKLQKSLGLKDPISFETVLKTLPVDRNASKEESKNHEQFLKVAAKALDNLAISRAHEGKILVNDIKKRFFLIMDWFEKIERQVPILREKRKSDVAAKIAAAIQDLPVDSKRIEGEIALLIEKADVTEEIVRFKKHLQSFQVLLQTGVTKKSVGRELDFTLQEMNREINTLGAKISDVEMSKIVVNIKSEMEKIREQVQNIQ